MRGGREERDLASGISRLSGCCGNCAYFITKWESGIIREEEGDCEANPISLIVIK